MTSIAPPRGSVMIDNLIYFTVERDIPTTATRLDFMFHATADNNRLATIEPRVEFEERAKKRMPLALEYNKKRLSAGKDFWSYIIADPYDDFLFMCHYQEIIDGDLYDALVFLPVLTYNRIRSMLPKRIEREQHRYLGYSIDTMLDIAKQKMSEGVTWYEFIDRADV